MSKARKKKRGGKRPGAGRPPKLSPQLGTDLRDLALANHRSLADLVALFKSRTGISISTGTARKVLLAQGLARTKSRRPRRRSTSAPKPVSDGAGGNAAKTPTYGYNERHCPKGAECGTSLTDAEWGLVSDLFEHNGPGRPPTLARRTLLDACCYVVRTGCAWRRLPHGFPSWENVYAHFRRWSAEGRFETMQDRLRKMWRDREHRTADPSAACLDSQSLKSTAQGGPRASTRARR